MPDTGPTTCSPARSLAVRLVRATDRPALARAARGARRLAGRLRGRRRAVLAAATPSGPAPPRGGPVRVRFADWEAVEVRRPADPEPLLLRLDDGTARVDLSCYRVVISVPDVASLVRLATAGVLHGRARALQVRIATFPREHRVGLRLPRPGKLTTEVSWSQDDDGVARVAVRCSALRPLHVLLDEVTRGAVRAHHWDQAGGRRYGLDRSADLDGASPWPAGTLLDLPVPPSTDQAPQSLTAPRAGGLRVRLDPPVMTVVANPVGRTLVGSPAQYRAVVSRGRLELRDAGGAVAVALDSGRPAEAALADGSWQKYAVAWFDRGPGPDPFVRHAVRCLAATGVVPGSRDPAVRAELAGLGVLATDDAERSDLAWYRLSVDAWRGATVGFDPVLRHTALSPAGGPVTLPAVSVLASSRRPDDLLRLLPDLCAQSYPAVELLVGTHGYRLDGDEQRRLGERCELPLRVVEVPAELTLGESLGRLSRVADGELLAKVDDDDHYGHHHLTDLVLTLHSTGADCVAKGARFVWLPELNRTIDRAWTAPELHDVYVAGGTMLLPRRALLEAGGWSTSPRHVDTHLAERLRAAGGTVRRLHGLDYLYVRSASGHTWDADMTAMLAQGEASFEGLPEEVVQRRDAAPATPAAAPGAASAAG